MKKISSLQLGAPWVGVFAAIACCVIINFSSRAAEPLRALLITGGCCHDYNSQKKILTEGINARVNVKWTVIHEHETDKKHKPDIYTNANWAQGFDVVVHNECFGGVTNNAFVERIARPHLDGLPAVVLHCSMHSYREASTDDWRKVLGVSSYRHQQHVAFEVKNLKPEHPVMKGFPASWQTPKGELYEIEKLWPGCLPLAEAYGVRTKKEHTCVWVNSSGKIRTFGTTIGHFNEEMDNEVFLGLVSRGLLWACDKLDADGKPKAGFGKQ